jgi:prepilin-type processing-associated H-X9-DG protein
MFSRLGMVINIAAVTDGLSNTIMIGESLPGQNGELSDDPNDRAWYSIKSGTGEGTTIIPINYRSDSRSPTMCDPPDRHYQNWGVSMGYKSNHPGGTQFVFGDGSVHFLSQTIEMRTYQLLGCRNDGQAFSLP